MLDPFDYKEPSCPTSDGKQFYYPSQDDPKGKIPVRRIIERLDSFFEVNDTAGAGTFSAAGRAKRRSSETRREKSRYRAS